MLPKKKKHTKQKINNRLDKIRDRMEEILSAAPWIKLSTFSLIIASIGSLRKLNILLLSILVNFY
jgi:hypothetical protein